MPSRLNASAPVLSLDAGKIHQINPSSEHELAGMVLRAIMSSSHRLFPGRVESHAVMIQFILFSLRERAASPVNSSSRWWSFGHDDRARLLVEITTFDTTDTREARGQDTREGQAGPATSLEASLTTSPCSSHNTSTSQSKPEPRVTSDSVYFCYNQRNFRYRSVKRGPRFAYFSVLRWPDTKRIYCARLLSGSVIFPKTKWLWHANYACRTCLRDVAAQRRIQEDAEENEGAIESSDEEDDSREVVEPAFNEEDEDGPDWEDSNSDDGKRVHENHVL